MNIHPSRQAYVEEENGAVSWSHVLRLPTSRCVLAQTLHVLSRDA
jgi:hypothetical protein